jgi:hypothetical protein
VVVDAATFKAEFPEFSDADDVLVTAELGNAELLTPSSVWTTKAGDLRPLGIKLRAAVAIAQRPGGRAMQIDSDGKTVYDRRLEELIGIVSSGGRVI